MFIYKLQDEVNDNDFKYIKICKRKKSKRIALELVLISLRITYIIPI